MTATNEDGQDYLEVGLEMFDTDGSDSDED